MSHDVQKLSAAAERCTVPHRRGDVVLSRCAQREPVEAGGAQDEPEAVYGAVPPAAVISLLFFN